jgi:hypothetical protein
MMAGIIFELNQCHVLLRLKSGFANRETRRDIGVGTVAGYPDRFPFQFFDLCNRAHQHDRRRVERHRDEGDVHPATPAASMAGPPICDIWISPETKV